MIGPALDEAVNLMRPCDRCGEALENHAVKCRRCGATLTNPRANVSTSGSGNLPKNGVDVDGVRLAMALLLRLALLFGAPVLGGAVGQACGNPVMGVLIGGIVSLLIGLSLLLELSN